MADTPLVKAYDTLLNRITKAYAAPTTPEQHTDLIRWIRRHVLVWGLDLRDSGLDPSGWTILHQMSFMIGEHSDREGPCLAALISTLVSMGADVNASVKWGCTPCHTTLGLSCSRCFVETLLRMGADPNRRNHYNQFVVEDSWRCNPGLAQKFPPDVMLGVVCGSNHGAHPLGCTVATGCHTVLSVRNKTLVAWAMLVRRSKNMKEDEEHTLEDQLGLLANIPTALIELIGKTLISHLLGPASAQPPSLCVAAGPCAGKRKRHQGPKQDGYGSEQDGEE